VQGGGWDAESPRVTLDSPDVKQAGSFLGGGKTCRGMFSLRKVCEEGSTSVFRKAGDRVTPPGGVNDASAATGRGGAAAADEGGAAPLSNAWPSLVSSDADRGGAAAADEGGAALLSNTGPSLLSSDADKGGAALGDAG
jgi:hypothetical protein